MWKGWEARAGREGRGGEGWGSQHQPRMGAAGAPKRRGRRAGGRAGGGRVHVPARAAVWLLSQPVGQLLSRCHAGHQALSEECSLHLPQTVHLLPP